MSKTEATKDLSYQSCTKKNKAVRPPIYISKECEGGGGEVVQGLLEKDTEEKNVESAVLNNILDALSQGIARSIVGAAVKSISPIPDTYNKQGGN